MKIRWLPWLSLSAVVLMGCPVETLNVGSGDVSADVGDGDAGSDADADTDSPDADTDTGNNVWEPRDLTPVADWIEAGYVARAHPKTVELSQDEQTVFVGLAGNLINPLNIVLALDASSGAELARIEVGSSPQGLQLSNDGTKLYVTNQFSNYVSVIDVAQRTNVGQIPVSFYGQDLVMGASGVDLFITNRWHDAVEVVKLDAANGTSGTVSNLIPVGTNPRDIVRAENGILFVGNLAATSISVVDVALGRETKRIHTNAPVNGLATRGPLLFVATQGQGDGHEAIPGMTNGVAYRGDGTANTGFGDIDNDIIVINTDSQGQLQRYTSDTAEVSHVDVEGGYPAAMLIVVGALPEQAAVAGDNLFVTMSSSDQIQCLSANPITGQLTHQAVFDTGINPHELAVTSDGATIYVANRLGETVSKIDTATNTKVDWPVGITSPPYPANEYETGEMFFHSARFSSEALPSAVFPGGDKAGDKSCQHCHREALTDGKVWTVGVGLVTDTGGERIPPSARNIRDTLPLFWEGVQTEADFDLEAGEFAPLEDFEGVDEEAEAEARDAFFIQQVGVDFERLSRELIGEFLIGRPRLMPNPEAQFPSVELAASAARGKALFEQRECATCHPSTNSAMPFTTNDNLDPVITPSGLDNGFLVQPFEEDGKFNIPSLRGVWDRPRIFFHDGRGKSLRSAILGPDHPALIAGVDGCHNLADEVATTGALFRPVYNGRGCNVTGATPDTHGRTSDLNAAQVEDLLNFVRSIE